jgi:hypothetical protein
MPEIPTQLLYINNFNELITTPFKDNYNAICWKRILEGDFEELVNAITLEENMMELSEEDLLELKLSENGIIARDTILSDLKLLSNLGFEPVLNIIDHYEADEDLFFPRDVYSFHVDRSPIPTDTYLCTYFGDTSELIPNDQAILKINDPLIRQKLLTEYSGDEENFKKYLEDNFFDLHYNALPNATITKAKLGHFWKLAVDHPESNVLPCIHRAPKEISGQRRLLMIC